MIDDKDPKILEFRPLNAKDKEVPPNFHLIHHYTHVIVALADAAKAATDPRVLDAIVPTLNSACTLVTKLVTAETPRDHA